MESLSRTEIRSIRALSRRGMRARRGETILEGWRALDAALARPQQVLLVALSGEAAASARGRASIPLLEAAGIPLRLMDEQRAAELSGTQSSQGVLARLQWKGDRLPGSDEVAAILAERGIRSLFALDRVSDPGNVGTLIRTALALGVDGVLLGRGTVEAASPKVVRSSAGSIFLLPLVAEEVDLPSVLSALAGSGWEVLRAEAGGGSAPPAGRMEDRWVLLLGSEARGVDASLAAIGRSVHLPLTGDAESLNVAVAGGIIGYLLKNGRDRK